MVVESHVLCVCVHVRVLASVCVDAGAAPDTKERERTLVFLAQKPVLYVTKHTQTSIALPEDSGGCSCVRGKDVSEWAGMPT